MCFKEFPDGNEIILAIYNKAIHLCYAYLIEHLDHAHFFEYKIIIWLYWVGNEKKIQIAGLEKDHKYVKQSVFFL